MQFRDRLFGAIYGHLVGDAFGVPYEFLSPSELPPALEWRGHGTHNQPPGTWSDDGALLLCLLASLTEKQEFDSADAGRRFVAWRQQGYMAAGGVVFDIGGTTATAIYRLRDGVEPLNAGPAEEQHCGNGSLMRILPLSLWTARETRDRQILFHHSGSRLTHGHPRAQACCAVYGLLVRFILENQPRAQIWEMALAATEEAYRRAAQTWGAPFLDAMRLVRQHPVRTGGGYVIDCLCSAWDAVARAGDYPDAIRRAVRFGNDTDTTAAVAGGLAGLLFGVDAIPSDWRAQLRLTPEQRREIENFVESLVKQVAQTRA